MLLTGMTPVRSMLGAIQAGSRGGRGGWSGEFTPTAAAAAVTAQESDSDGEDDVSKDEELGESSAARQIREHGTGNKKSTMDRYGTFVDPNKKWLKASVAIHINQI